MRLVVFDCDGTLVDSQNLIVSAVCETFSLQGLESPLRAQILSAVGLPLNVAMRRHAPNCDDAIITELISNYRKIADRLSMQDDRGQIIFEGVREVIEMLGNEKDTVMGIVTMKSRIGLNRVVDVHNLRQFFPFLKSADDGPGKPRPDLLLDVIRESGVGADKTVMIGDTSYDMLMAKSADAYAIGVAWGYQSVDALLESGADAIATTSHELTAQLETHR